MNPDDIYLARFPFGGSVGMKLRPVLLLTGPVGDVPEHACTNLKTTSVVRLHKLATIHARNLVRRLGILPLDSVSEVDRKLQRLLSL